MFRTLPQQAFAQNQHCHQYQQPCAFHASSLPQTHEGRPTRLLRLRRPPGIRSTLAIRLSYVLYRNFTFFVVISAIAGNPSWIFNFSISPCPTSSQYRMKLTHAGCKAIADVLSGSILPFRGPAPCAIVASDTSFDRATKDTLADIRKFPSVRPRLHASRPARSTFSAVIFLLRSEAPLELRFFLALLLLCIASCAQELKPAEHDFAVQNFRFKSGESVPTLKLHYYTFGTLQKDSAG